MIKKYIEDPDLTIWHGDAKETLAVLPESSIDCIVTSPPYWGLRDYGEEGQVGLEGTPDSYVSSMTEIFAEAHRVLAGHGTLWLNLGDTYAANRSYQVKDSKHVDVGNSMAAVIPPGLKPKDLVGIPWRVALALQAWGWYLRSDVIWHKLNPMPESVTDRPTKSHEYVFMFVKSERYFFDQEAVREPAEWNRWGDQTNEKYEGTKTGSGWIGSKTKHELMMKGRKSYPAGGTTGNRGADHIKGGSGEMPSQHVGGRNIRTVWSIPTQSYADAHFATFPMELPRRAISAGCPTQVCTSCDAPRSLTDCGHDAYRRGVVLDPFFGSGTTGLAARELERNCIGIELNRGYCEIAAKRLQQLSLLSDVAEAPNS